MVYYQFDSNRRGLNLKYNWLLKELGNSLADVAQEHLKCGMTGYLASDKQVNPHMQKSYFILFLQHQGPATSKLLPAFGS